MSLSGFAKFWIMRVLYIDIDSLRPDHLGCYGYLRDTSPVLDRIAGDGVVCEQVYTSDAPCLPSRTAFYSGRFGIQTGVVGHGGRAAQPKVQGAPSRGFRDDFVEQGLAGQLQKLGCRRITMISPFGQRHGAHWVYAGFHEIHNTGGNGMESADAILPVVRKWMADNGTRDNWFLHVNFWDPHTPYRVPGHYGDPFAADPLPAWLDSKELIARHKKAVGPHSILDITDREDPRFPRQPASVKDRAGMRRLIDGYDTAIRYVDDAVGHIVASLERAGIYDDTAIIISADHGENFGELGIYAEHATADEGTCHVPLIIKFPGGARGARDAGLHYQLDLAPTLLELLGGAPPDIWDGTSFASTIRTGEADGRKELIIGQCAHVCQRSVRWDNWLYMRTYHDGFHLFPNEMLFDLRADPHEQNNLAEQRGDLCREGTFRLAHWHDAQMRKMVAASSDVIDPLWTVIREGGPYHAGFSASRPDAERFLQYLKRLEHTGRAEGAAALRAKYNSELARIAGHPAPA
jgi:choline-sulfatase